MINRRAVGNRKIVLCSPDVPEVCDPAIDLELSDIEAYHSSLFDPQYLVFKPDERPTYFTIRMVTENQKEHFDETYVRRLISWYIRCGVISHENYTIVDDAGNSSTPDQPDLVAKGKLGTVSSEKWLHQMMFTSDIALLLFTMIKKISEAQGPLFSASSRQFGAKE